MNLNRVRLGVAWAALTLVILVSTPLHAQGVITSGETLTGTIAPAGDSDTWTFSANTGDVVVIRVGEITQTGNFAPRIRLFSPGAVLLATASSSVGAEIVTTAASSGTFTVTVDDNVGTTATGTYRLSLARTGGAVTVTPGDEGGPLTNGAVHTGTIDVGDLDVYTVSASAGDAIVVRAAEVVSGTSLTPWLRIYSPSGALLDSLSSTVGTEVVVTAPSAGTYMVVLADNSSSYAGAGAYRLTMAKTGSPVTVSPGDEGGPLTNGALHMGTLDLGDLDVFTVSANVGEAIVVRAAEVVSGTSLAPWLRIYSPSGALLDSSTSAVGAEVAVTAASTGTYLVVLADNSSSYAGAGAYRLTMAKTGSPVTVSPGDEGGPLINGAMHTGTLDLGDLDVFTVSANLGEAIVVRAAEIVAGTALTPWLRIYSPSGTLLGNSTTAVAAEVAVTAASSGTYLVVLADNSSAYASAGAYRLTLAKTGAPVTVSPGDEGGPLPTGQNLATIDLGDLDVWTAYYNVGDGIAITMQEITAGSPLAPWLRVYGPTGTLVGNASNAATALVTVTAPASGVYVVVAGDGSSAYAGTGPYRLTKTAGAAANANLTNLTLSQGGLNPAFASGTLQYTANVVSADNTITVTPTLADPTATVAANGVTVASGTPSQSITLVVGTNPISVVVTAQNGTTRTYTVNVDFAFPPLCTYAVSPPDLSNQPKSGGPAQYVVTVPAGCPVTVTPFQPWVTVNSITPNGGTTTVSLQIAPNPGPTRATAIVTAGRLYLITQLPGP